MKFEPGALVKRAPASNNHHRKRYQFENSIGLVEKVIFTHIRVHWLVNGRRRNYTMKELIVLTKGGPR